jgi:hypothetical protein
MYHNQVQNILEDLKDRNNLQAIQIKTSSTNFKNRFKGVSSMFRVMKNSLHSMQGISNRTYFKGLSGMYFSECNGDDFEIIIIYDTSLNNLNRIQVISRLRKMLGFDIQTEFGSFEQFEGRIRQMVGIVRKTQTFGDWYKHL